MLVVFGVAAPFIGLQVIVAVLIASGLPSFQASSGWKNVGVNALVGVDFDGDLTNGGLAGFVTGGYTKLLNDAKRTPLTSIRGDADQWLAGAGLAFTF